MEAIPVALLLQEPPPASDNVELLPGQTANIPEMADGGFAMVSVAVAKQPVPDK
jgi:hypothetical protein